MKKLMCLLVLVAFLGSMSLTTGCGGSSGGLGAIFAGALIIALVASGPTAVAFAANTRADMRPAIMAAATESSKYVARITPTGQAPTEIATLTIDGEKISFASAQISPSSNGQYVVEIFPKNYDSNTSPLFKHYFTKPDPAGETVDESATPIAINASDTAKALIYDAWVGSSANTINNALFNQTNIDDLSKELEKEMKKIATDTNGDIAVPTDFAWTGAVETLATTGAGNVTTQYTITGYVTAADGGGQTGCIVHAWSDEAMETYAGSIESTNGNYSLVLPNGTYYIEPYKQSHTYEPEFKKVVIDGANKASIDFRAARATSGHP